MNNYPDWDISVQIDWPSDTPIEQRSQTEGLIQDIIDLEWGHDTEPQDVIGHLEQLCSDLEIPATFTLEDIL